MPLDPDDESNVLVPSPNKASEQTNKNLENEESKRTKMLLANKFGSTFKVLPDARDKPTSGTRGESSGTSGAVKKVLGSNLLYFRTQSPSYVVIVVNNIDLVNFVISCSAYYSKAALNGCTMICV